MQGEVAPLEVTDLCVSFGQTRVLDNVSMRLEPGRTVALMGPNGCGKSTLVKAIVGINPIAAGSVSFFGIPHCDRRFRSQLRRVGYVPQRIGADGGVPSTALEVVRSGLLGPGRLLPRPGDTARALKALERVNLAHRAGDRVATFSGGQAQRVLIARALVRAPRLLIMDEPLAGIDAASRDSLAEAVADMKKAGVAMLIVLHETGTLAPLLDTAITLEEGRVICQGSPLPPAPGHESPDHDHVHPHADVSGGPSLF